MKKNHSFSKVLAIILTGIFITLGSTVLLANETKPSTADLPVRINYMGEKNLLPVFEIQIDNGEESDYFIVIKDAGGVSLYTEKLNAKKISKRFVLEADDLEAMGTSFEVTNKKTNETSVYKIFRQIKDEDTLVVYRSYTAW
jgi:hypothetical protein